MGLIQNKAFFAAAALFRRDFARRTARTEQEQRGFLTAFLDDFKTTRQGIDLDLAGITGIDRFRARIPARDYAAVAPYADRVFAGEANVMTPDRPLLMTVSSGTTGRRKLVPITPASLRLRNRARQASTGFFAKALHARGGSLGTLLMTNCSTMIGRTDIGLRYGMNSACDLTLNESRYRGRRLLPYPFDVLTIEDVRARHYVCLLFALRASDLRIVAGNFPTYIMQIVALLTEDAPALIRDIDRGCIHRELDIVPALRAALEERMLPDPERAIALSRLLQATGGFRPRDIWPGLAAIVTARGAPSRFYLEQFAEPFGDRPVFGGIYGAVEALYGVYTAFDSDEAALAVDNGFFEFVPEDQWDRPFPDTRLAHEVAPGHYRILVTNRSGMIRYDIGDVVEVLGRFKGAPTFTFVRRKGGLLNAVHEMTTGHHVEQALERVREALGLAVSDFMVALGIEKPFPAYHLAFELPADATCPPLPAVAAAFDRALQAVHDVYRNKRCDTLPPPVVWRLAPGSFAAARARRGRVAGADTNVKLPRVTEDRAYLDDFTRSAMAEFSAGAA